MEELYVLEIINDGYVSYVISDDLKSDIKAIYNVENPDSEDLEFQKKLLSRINQAYSNEDYIDILDYANSYNDQWVYVDLYVVVEITSDLKLTNEVKKRTPLKFVAANIGNDIEWCDIKIYDYDIYFQTHQFDDKNSLLKSDRMYYIHNCYDKDIAINIAKLLVNET